ncbi:MAG: YbjN domain-containing protein [Flavobacteriales bacterium]|nr:YbjN domain-containing protein [Flavobacteriales bacterium]
MELQPFFDTVEDAIRTLGVDPEITRCEQSGQWILQRGDVEIYIDVWQPQTHNQWEYFRDEEPATVFQVVAPVCYLPDSEEEKKDFVNEILHINHHLFYGCFTINEQENMVAISFKRLIEGINRVEMIEPIEAIGFYAENFGNYFPTKYSLKKIEKN